jgi:HNH endonuclease
MSRPKTPLRDRFLRFVVIPADPDQCWAWTGSKNEHGYGRLQKGTTPPRATKAHRASWSIYHGPIPDGLHVLHRCDNPECSNPRHLFLGTHQENMLDSKTKGRPRGPQPGTVSVNVGSANGRAKLTENQITEIRHRVSSGELQREVGARFGIRQSTVSGIINGKRWRGHPIAGSTPASGRAICARL